jgi:hypothetical protein
MRILLPLPAKNCRQRGIELKKVVDALNHYMQEIILITRLKKKSTSGEYRHKINKSSVEAYLQYKHRVKHGFDLNRHRYILKLVDFYYSKLKTQKY